MVVRVAGLVLTLLLAGAAAAPASNQAGGAPAVTAKKKCKIVIKIVHGKKRKVRVCHTVKPKTVKSVSIKLDSSHAATRLVSAAEGGTITTRAANGTKLTLTVPKDALLADTTVTMTPVASISGLPKGLRFLGGVQLAPEGTSLGKDGTLTVETRAAASAKHVRAVGWDGNGKNPFAYKATRTGSAVRISVIHFSGVAAEDGVQPWASVALDWLRLTYHQVRDLMVQATTTDSLAFARAALGRWLNWERQAELIGGEQFMADQRRELREVLLPKVIKNGIEKSYERCKTNHDVLEELTLLQGVQRQTQLLGLNDLSTLAQTKVEQCGRFELDFESRITWVISTPDGSVHGSSHVKVTRLKLNVSNNWTDGAPLEYSEFVWQPDFDLDPCSTETKAQADQPFAAELVQLGEIPPPDQQGHQGPPDPTKLKVTVHADGTATEKITITCPPPGGNASVSHHIWVDSFAAFHHGASFTINDWDYIGGSLYARKTYSQTGGGGASATEQTSLELWHTPE